MKIYFPQWQGSGTGYSIHSGARTLLQSLDEETYIKIPLSDTEPGENMGRRHNINNYDAIIEQLDRLKSAIEKYDPDTIKIIGGDCGLEIVPVSFLNSKYPNLGVIWFDAHADINRARDSKSCNFHGMPLRTLLGDGEKEMDRLLFSKIKASQIHYVGLRDLDAAEQIKIDEDNIYARKNLDINDLLSTLQQKQIKQLYLHFDCLEPSEYNKTYYQVPDGIKIKEAESCIKALQQNFEVVGTSVLESIATLAKELVPIEGIIKLLMR